MRRLRYVALAALVWTGCDKPKEEAQEVKQEAAEARAEAKEEVKEEAPAKSLKAPLAEGVELGFDHNAMLNREQQVAEVNQRMLVIESVGTPLPDALSKLEGNLVAAGFEKEDEQDLNGSLIRSYHRNGDISKAGGQVVRIQANAYDAEKPYGGTGTLNITVKKNTGG